MEPAEEFLRRCRPLASLLRCVKDLRHHLRGIYVDKGCDASYDDSYSLAYYPIACRIEALSDSLSIAIDEFPELNEHAKEIRGAIAWLDLSWLYSAGEEEPDCYGYSAAMLCGATDEIEIAAARMESFIAESARELFGDWAAFFFAKGITGLDDEFFSLMPRPTLLPRGLTKAMVNLNDSDFTVSIAGREPLSLGNTYRWMLFKILWERADSFVPYSELRKVLGKGTDDELKFDKKRLVDDLNKGGYADLVSCIRSTPKHYGLFFA